MKSHTRLLTSILIISAIANTVGCSKDSNAKGDIFVEENIRHEYVDETFAYKKDVQDIDVLDKNVNDNLDNNISISFNSEGDTFESKETNIEGILRENLYDENIDYNLIIQTYIDNYDLREEYRNEYLKAIYMLLLNSNVEMSEYLKELHTMVVMQQIPMCVSNDIWNEQFKNLIALDPNCISLFDKYCDFAIYVHSLECEEEHKLNDYYCYTCPKLEEEYTRKLEKNS